MNKWNLSMFILIACFITMFAMIGCGGGGGGSIDPIPVIPTNTPTSPNQPTVAPTPIKYGSIIGRAYLSDNVPLNNGYIVCKSFVVSEKSDDKSLLALLTSSSTPFTANTNTDPNGEFNFPSFPQGPGRIEAWKNLSDYQADPNNPIAAVNLSIIEETKGLELHQGEVEPTPVPTPTAIPTATNTPGGPTIPPLPTNTPGGPTETPTNTPPAGATNTPTATNTVSPTPTNTTVPSGDPSITSVINTSTGGSVAKDTDTITITGTNLGAGTVSINGTNAGIVSTNSTTVTCTVTTGSFKNNGPIVSLVYTRSSDSKTASFDKMVLYSYNSSDAQDLTSIASPGDVAFDSSGNYFYISDILHASIKRYNFSTRNNDYTSTSMPGAASYINFCGTNSNIYATVGTRIYKFVSDLSSSTTIGGPGIYGASDGISWNSTLGKILILDYNASGSTLYSHNLDGSNMQTFLDQSTLNIPAGPMCSDQDGNIFVGSTDTNQIKKFNSSGTLQCTISQNNPKAISAYSSGSYTILFVSGTNALSQSILAIYYCIGTNSTKLGEIIPTGYGTSGLDFFNHNLLICSTSPKAILLLKL